MMRKLPSFLRLQLRPHKQNVSASPSDFGLEIGRIGHLIRLPLRISSIFPTSGGRNLVGGLSQEGKWYFSLEEKNKSKFIFSESWFRKKQTKVRDAFYFKSVSFRFIWMICFPLCLSVCDYVVRTWQATQTGWVTSMRPAFSASSSSWAFQQPWNFRKTGTGFPGAMPLPDQSCIIQTRRL